MMALSAEPTARTFGLEELLRLVTNGKIRIPHFQRGIRWGPKEAAELVDSVLRGFPIGSILLWRRSAPAERIRVGDLFVEAAASPEAYFVVDGQQRITTLSNALSRDSGFEGRFALEVDIKTLAVRPRQGGSTGTIPLPTLFHLRDYLQWTQKFPQWEEYIEQLNDAASRLREFHIPAYVVESDDEATLKEIFDRMNSAGKRLSRAEVFSALFAADEASVASSSSISKIQEYVSGDLKWGFVDDDTILRVVLARRAPDVTREIRLEFSDSRRNESDFPNEDQQGAYLGAEAALGKAVSYLRDVGVPHFSVLPYRYLLIVLCRFFSLFPQPTSHSREMLSRWLWRAAVVGPNVSKASTTGAVRQFASAIKANDESGSIERLLALVPREINWRPNVHSFRANQAESRIMLCALWSRGPTNLLSSTPISHDDLSEAIGQASTANSVSLEVVKRSMLSTELRNSIGNRVILTEPTDDIAATVATGEIPGDVLASHVVMPEMLEALREGSFDVFVRRRAEELAHVIEDYVVRCTGARFEDLPPLSTFDFQDDELREDEILDERDDVSF